MAVNAQDQLSQALADLESILEREALALRRLDREEIDRLTSEKVAVQGRLETLKGTASPAPSEGPRLEKIRKLALQNQLLLVHARDCVRGLIATMTGAEVGSYPTTRPPPRSSALRLNLRG